ncbi:MAG: hypothetical protein WA681_06680, partial [Candidatus Acidiferrales bacterium]
WLLYDADAIARAFREHLRPRLPGNPELLADPKKSLREIIWKRYRKQYLNTVHNSQIAKHIQISRLRRAGSFLPHLTFTAKVRAAIQQT